MKHMKGSADDPGPGCQCANETFTNLNPNQQILNISLSSWNHQNKAGAGTTRGHVFSSPGERDKLYYMLGLSFQCCVLCTLHESDVRQNCRHSYLQSSLAVDECRGCSGSVVSSPPSARARSPSRPPENQRKTMRNRGKTEFSKTHDGGVIERRDRHVRRTHNVDGGDQTATTFSVQIK